MLSPSAKESPQLHQSPTTPPSPLFRGAEVIYTESSVDGSASAVILEAKKSQKIGKVYAGKNGILGALREELIDTSKESKKFIESLKYRPGGVFGSWKVP